MIKAPGGDWRLLLERRVAIMLALGRLYHESDMAAWARRVVRFVDGRVDSDTRNERPAGLDAAAVPAAEAPAAASTASQGAL